MLKWNSLSRSSDLDSIIESSHDQQVVIFKHSTRCSVSSIVRSRLEGQWPKDASMVPMLVDVIADCHISNSVAERFNVRHESPQMLLIEKGKCRHHASHFDIDLAAHMSVGSDD